MYHIVITKFEKRTEEELELMEKERAARREDFYPGMRNNFKENEHFDKYNKRNKALEVIITEEEFKVIKKAAIEIM